MTWRHWPAVLTLLAILVFGSYLLYTERLVREIRAESQIQTQMYGLVQQGLLSLDDDAELKALMRLQTEFTALRVPIVAVNVRGDPYAAVNLPFAADMHTAAGRRRLLEFAARLQQQNPPITVPGAGTVYFGSPPLVAWLRWVPWLQAGGGLLLLLVAAAVLRANARADRERMWAAMARELAHQMGTPLSSLAGWIEVLGLPDEERRSFASPERLAEVIGADVERLERVSRRFELIGKPPRLEETSLPAVLRELESYLRPRLPQLGAGVDLRLRIRPGMPHIQANAVLLAWALENLVKNALDALAGRGGSIRIAATTTRDGRFVRIMVVDDGPGIPAAVRERIFEPGVSTKSSGWGVGLSLTRRIIEDLHHGRIVVRPRRRGGTVFDILLPAVEERRRKRWLPNRAGRRAAPSRA